MGCMGAGVAWTRTYAPPRRLRCAQRGALAAPLGRGQSHLRPPHATSVRLPPAPMQAWNTLRGRECVALARELLVSGWARRAPPLVAPRAHAAAERNQAKSCPALTGRQPAPAAREKPRRPPSHPC